MDSPILPFLRALVAYLLKRRSSDLDMARDLRSRPVLTRFAFFFSKLIRFLALNPGAKF